MKNDNKKNEAPVQLPVVKMNGKSYFVDERLKQYRNVEDSNDVIEFEKDEVIVYSYSRAEALKDGVLVDISDLAHEAGFKCPLAVTRAIYELLNNTYQPGQSFEGRAWDLLMVLRFEITRSKNRDVIYFGPYFNAPCHIEPRPYEMWAKCGPGDNHEPVITVMFLCED